MMSRLQTTVFSTILIFLFIFVFFSSTCYARPWPSASSSSSSMRMYRFGDDDYSNLSNFQPNPGYLSRTYLFNWIPESSEEALTPIKRNIAIGRGDGFRPGK